MTAMLQHGEQSTATNTACPERSRRTLPTCSNPAPGKRPPPLAMNPGPSATLPWGQQWCRLAGAVPTLMLPAAGGARGQGYCGACGYSPSLCRDGCNASGYLVLGVVLGAHVGGHSPRRRRKLQRCTSHLPPGNLPALGSSAWGQCEQGKGMRLCSQTHLCAA